MVILILLGETHFALETAKIVFFDVGYMGGDSYEVGYKFVGPMFGKIGTIGDNGGTYSLQDIKPVGNTVPDGGDNPAEQGISIQKLAADGTTSGSIYYWRTGKHGRTTYNGWYTAAGTTQAEMTIEAGEGLCCKMPSGADCALQFAGGVVTTDVTVTLNNNGHTAVCNPQAAAITDVQTVLPAALPGYTVPDGGDNPAEQGISIQKIAADGTTDGSILYWRTGKHGRTTYNGWYTAAGTTAASMTIPAGCGLWVNCPAEGITLTFPAVITK